MLYRSILEQRSPVTFPEFIGERHYMVPFQPGRDLPNEVARWQTTVDQMMDGVPRVDVAYLLVHEKIVEAGLTHRRPGLHVDGYWHPDIRAHGGSSPGRHQGGPVSPPTPTAPPAPPPARKRNVHAWTGQPFDAQEAIILAASVTASRAFIGTFEGTIGDGGDCHGIATDHLTEVVLTGGHSFAGNVTMLHEGLPVVERQARTVVRINVPGWSPEII